MKTGHKQNRHPHDDCLICKSNRATKTKSHFIPNCLLKNSVGIRDYEHSFTFDLQTGEAEEYLGKDNPKGWSESGQIPAQPILHPYAGDYYFCPSCEEKLSKLEGELCGVFTGIEEFSLKHPGNVMQVPERRIVEINNKVPFEKFLAFVYSVLWRASLQLEYYDNNPTFYKSESEDFRKALYEYLYFGRTERIRNLATRYSLVILHPEGQINGTNNDFFAGGRSQMKYFTLFDYMFFLFKNTPLMEMVMKMYEADKITIDSRPKISLVSSSQWQVFLDGNREGLKKFLSRRSRA